MEMDIFLVALIAGGFLLGFLRGVIRQLIALAVWAGCFIVAAQLQRFFALYLLEQQAEFSLQYADMLAFGAIFLLTYVIAFVIIEVAGNVSDLTTHPVLDEVLGGVLAAGVVLLVIATVIVTLNMFYALENPGPTGEIGFLGALHRLFEKSAIAGWMTQSLIPGIGSLFGVFLPEQVRQAMG